MKQTFTVEEERKELKKLIIVVIISLLMIIFTDIDKDMEKAKGENKAFGYVELEVCELPTT